MINCCGKNPDRSILRKIVTLVSSLGFVQSVMGGKSRWQEHEATGHITPAVGKLRAVSVGIFQIKIEDNSLGSKNRKKHLN